MQTGLQELRKLLEHLENIRYGMGVITTEVLTAWELIVKTDESGKFHVGW